MSITLIVPTVFRRHTDDQNEVHLEAGTVKEALDLLVARYPDVGRSIYSSAGRLRNFINVYVNEEDVRYADGEETRLEDGDRVLLVPAVAGGSLEEQPFSPESFARYSRHLIIPEVGVEGQRRLRDAKVLIVGAGGLGTPAATYLAAAGVGKIGLVDFDRVERSNLHRQVLYSEADIGRPKVQVAKRRLESVNPLITIDPLEVRLDSSNALEVVSQYDVVVDGTDNFPTRYLVNDACVLLHRPNVYASIFRFEGQASVFCAKDGPCYRCLYPEPPPAGVVPSCAEGGVLGVLPGIMGAIQASQVVNIILGKGTPLIGRLLLFDSLHSTFETLRLRKAPECPACGENPTIRGLIDYEAFCGVEPGATEFDISPDELKRKLDSGERLVLLDVREPFEYEICHLPGAKLIPLGELRARVNQLDTSDEIVVNCLSGVRSTQGAALLTEVGFRKVRNLAGGLRAWANDVDPTLQIY